MQDFDDEFFGDEQEKVETPEPKTEPEADQPAEPAVEAAPEPKATEPEKEPETDKEPDKEPDGQKVPLAPFIEMRAENKELRARIEAMEKQAPPKPAQEPVKAPDPIEDPDGYRVHMEKSVEAAVTNRVLNLSEATARRTHGVEKVDAALEAMRQATATPMGQVAYQEVMGSPDPYEALVKWHGDQTVLNEIGADPEAYKAKVAAEVRAEIEAELATKQAKEMAAKAPPSMATATGIGGRDVKGGEIEDDLNALLG